MSESSLPIAMSQDQMESDLNILAMKVLKCERNSLVDQGQFRTTIIRKPRSTKREREPNCKQVQLCSAEQAISASPSRQSKRRMDSKMQGVFKCPTCPHAAIDSSALDNHILYIHSNERPFQCEIPGCDYSAKKRNDLRVHLKTHYKGDFIFCSAIAGCDFSARSTATIVKHAKECHGIGPIEAYVCHLPGCDVSVSRGNNLMRHLKVIHGLVKPSSISRVTFSRRPQVRNAAHESEIVIMEVDPRHQELLTHWTPEKLSQLI